MYIYKFIDWCCKPNFSGHPNVETNTMNRIDSPNSRLQRVPVSKNLSIFFYFFSNSTHFQDHYKFLKEHKYAGVELMNKKK